MLNIIFDFSFLSYRTLHTIKHTKTGEGRFLDSQSEQILFLRKLKQDLFAEISRFELGVDRIYLTLDTKEETWRKSIFPNYKAKRREKPEKDKIEINYEQFFRCVREFTKWVKENLDINVISAPTLESDDLIYFLVQSLKSKKESDNQSNSILIITSDRDLHQLIDYNKETDSYVVCYSNISTSRTVFIEKGLAHKFQLDDSSESVQSIKPKTAQSFLDPKISTSENEFECLRTLMDYDDVKYEVVDPSWILFNKLMCGDSSDVIPSIVKSKEEIEGIPRKMTKRESRKVFAELNPSNVESVNEIVETKKNELLDSLILNLKATDEKETREALLKNVERNFELISLTESNLGRFRDRLEDSSLFDPHVRVNQEKITQLKLNDDSEMVKSIFGYELKPDEKTLDITIKFNGGYTTT